MPAEAVSARPPVPQGVVEPRGGPGERTSGKVGRPLKRIVRVRSNDVFAAPAAPARQPKKALVAATATSPIQNRLPRPNTPICPAREGNRGRAQPPARFTGCLLLPQRRCEERDDWFGPAAEERLDVGLARLELLDAGTERLEEGVRRFEELEAVRRAVVH